MKKPPFARIFFLLLAVTGLMPAFSFAAETCNRVVAIVNNQVITLYELNKTIKEMTGYSAEDLRLRSEGADLSIIEGKYDIEFRFNTRVEKVEQDGDKATVHITGPSGPEVLTNAAEIAPEVGEA